MRLVTLIAVIFLTSLTIRLQAQLVDEMEEQEARFYAQTKQINQFFRRFNGEEDEEGNRYYPKDRKYRNARLRRDYLSMLFDENNGSVEDNLKVDFVKDVIDQSNADYLDFKGGDWFAEVNTTFKHNGQNKPVILFLKLEKDRLGTKWTIEKVLCDFFEPYFEKSSGNSNKFLHPMSHELDFMNLRKAFADKDSVAEYTVKEFKPDYLTLFIYELRKGNMKFETVKNVKFHFFQIDNWYFELSNFNRPGYNTGWLISNLVKVDSDKTAALLKEYIYGQ